MEIVACGPPSNKPAWVPETLAVRDGCRVLLVHKGDDETWSEISLEEEAGAGRLVPIGPLPYVQGWWVGIGPEGPSAFLKGEEPRWRLAQASELIRRRGSTPRPEDADGLLSAGALVGVNLIKALETMEANRNDPSESLTDIFLRLKKSGGMP